MDKRAPCLVQVGSQRSSPADSGLGLFLSLSWDMRDLKIKLGYDHLSLCSVVPAAFRATRHQGHLRPGVLCPWGLWPLASLPGTKGSKGLSSGEGQVWLAWISQRGGVMGSQQWVEPESGLWAVGGGQ